MAVGAWTFLRHSRKNIGNAKINLSATNFRMALFMSAALLSATKAVSTYNSLTNEVSQANGYTTNGGTKGLLANTWLSGASAGQYRFTFTTPRVWTAGGGSIANAKFAVIYCSGAASANKKILCYSQLSTAQFSITTGNTMTISASGTGVFNLA